MRVGDGVGRVEDLLISKPDGGGFRRIQACVLEHSSGRCSNTSNIFCWCGGCLVFEANWVGSGGFGYKDSSSIQIRFRFRVGIESDNC